VANRLELTQAYHKVSGSTLEAAAQAARSSFLSLGSWREDDIPRFIQQVVPSMNNSKRNMANYAVSYYKEMAGLAGEKFKMPDIDPASLSTQALRNGVTDDMIWSRPFKSMWTSLSKGNDISDALDAGARRAVDLARTDVQLARRGAGLQARSSNDRIVGYLRTLSGAENCALCYVASTQRYKKKDLLPIHPGCDCGEMPIYGKDDPGQIIDDIRLEATHDAVETRFGVQDRGGREPDYRKIKIQDHGELGPVLTVKGEKFTKLTPAKVDVPIKAPKKVEPKPFQKRIEPKLRKINSTKIAQDIAAEHGDVNVAGLRGKAKIQTLGTKTEAHLNAVKDVGKSIDNEILGRVKKEIDGLANPTEIASTQKLIKSAEDLLARTELDYEAGYQKVIAVKLAEMQERKVKARQALIDRGLSEAEAIQALNDPTGVWTDAEMLYRAKSNARLYYDYDRNSPGRKLRKEIDGYKEDITLFKSQLPANMVPGSPKYEQIYAAKAKEVLEELRSLGNGGPIFKGDAQAIDIISKGKQIYPDEWLKAAEAKFSRGLTAKKVGRGYFSQYREEIAISFDKAANGFEKGYATTVHEMGHMMEKSVPGLKELEFAFAHQRAATGTKRTKLGGKEVGFEDKWRNLYTGKDYGYGVQDSYEIFTTGIESVFAGSNMWSKASTVRNSAYINPSLNYVEAGLDDEFRQFILGVLFAL
jgi:hypothetical protein